MRFDMKQLLTAVELLFLGTIINVIPLFYNYLDAKYVFEEQNTELLTWLMANPEVYFLLLSTVVISFIEYLLTAERKSKGLIWFNFVYIAVVSAIWAFWMLREEFITKIVGNGLTVWHFAVIVILAVAFCVSNLVAMNQLPNINKNQSYAERRII